MSDYNPYLDLEGVLLRLESGKTLTVLGAYSVSVLNIGSGDISVQGQLVPMNVAVTFEVQNDDHRNIRSVTVNTLSSTALVQYTGGGATLT